jgi:hypothetical protein
MSEDERRPFDLIPLYKIKRRAVPWLWRGWVPANGVTLLPGDPKLAKSTLALDWAAKLSRGEIGDPNRAPTSIVVTGEDPVAEVVEPRVAAAGGELCHVHVLDVTDPEAVFTLPEHTADLEQRIFEIGAQLAIIDPLNRFLAETVDGHKDQAIRRAMGPLHQVAERQRCAIVVVAHLNKAMGANPLYRVGGSIGLTGAARSVLLFAKDPEDPDGERGRRRILAQAGSNYGQQQPSRRYRIEPTLLPAEDGTPEVETIRLIDEGEVEIAASDLLSTPTGEARSALEEACDFLNAELADGSQPAEDVRRRARKAGIADRTLDRARDKRGVKPHRVGGIGSAGHWEWSLTTPKGAGALSDRDVGALSENRAGMRDSGASEPLRTPTESVASLDGANAQNAGCPSHPDRPASGCRYCRGDRG